MAAFLRTELTFVVNCLVSCAQKKDISFLSRNVAKPPVSTFVSSRTDKRSVAPRVTCVTWVRAPRGNM